MVESEGNDSAYSKKEEAVGCLQIRPIMVREVNRILEIQKSDLEYTLEDRWSREKSIEMFHIVNGYHNKNSTYEEIARAWNGGPNWFKKGLTKRYWKRVQKQLKKQKKDERSNTRLKSNIMKVKPQIDLDKKVFLAEFLKMLSYADMYYK